MHNPKKHPFSEYAKDAFLGAAIGMFYGSGVSVFIALIVGGCAYILMGADQETQNAAVFPTLSTSAMTCVVVGIVLGARAGHYEGLGLSLTVIKGVIIGGSIGVIASLFTGIVASTLIGSVAGILSAFWFDR